MKNAVQGFLQFNGHTHYMERLIAKAMGSPTITVQKGDIDLDGQLPVRYREYTSHTEELIIFYKHAGKTYILLGRQLVLETMKKGHTEFIGRLLSSPALKDTRVPTEAPVAPVQQPQQSFDAVKPPTPTGFENRPRMAQSRPVTPRTQVDRHSSTPRSTQPRSDVGWNK